MLNVDIQDLTTREAYLNDCISPNEKIQLNQWIKKIEKEFDDVLKVPDSCLILPWSHIGKVPRNFQHIIKSLYESRGFSFSLQNNKFTLRI